MKNFVWRHVCFQQYCSWDQAGPAERLFDFRSRVRCHPQAAIGLVETRDWKPSAVRPNSKAAPFGVICDGQQRGQTIVSELSGVIIASYMYLTAARLVQSQAKIKGVPCPGFPKFVHFVGKDG